MRPPWALRTTPPLLLTRPKIPSTSRTTAFFQPTDPFIPSSTAVSSRMSSTSPDLPLPMHPSSPFLSPRGTAVPHLRRAKFGPSPNFSFCCGGAFTDFFAFFFFTLLDWRQRPWLQWFSHLRWHSVCFLECVCHSEYRGVDTGHVQSSGLGKPSLRAVLLFARHDRAELCDAKSLRRGHFRGSFRNFRRRESPEELSDQNVGVFSFIFFSSFSFFCPPFFLTLVCCFAQWYPLAQWWWHQGVGFRSFGSGIPFWMASGNVG